MEIVRKIRNWIHFHNIFREGWHEYHNPYYYWWKARKYFKRPKAHLVKGRYGGYFGLPCRTDSYHKGLNFFCQGLGWKSKWDSPRHEWDPIVCIVWVNPWKTWTPNKFSKETNSKGENGYYENKQYWFGWIFNWVKKDSDFRNESFVSSMATWEAILDFIHFDKSIEWCKANHAWSSGSGGNAHKIIINDNLKV